MSAPIDQVIEKVLSVYNSWGRATTPEQMRMDWDVLFDMDDANITVEYTEIEGVQTAWIGNPTLPRDRVFIYLHGGGYQVGSICSHADLVSRISEKSGITGLSVGYKRSPEHIFPTQISECEKVYNHLLAQGLKPEHIAFIGDSAGGNLALATLLSLKQKNIPLPAALALMSPWTDLEARGKSYETRAQQDPIHQRGMILHMADLYLAGADPSAPLASPINADVRGFPPTLIQVGDRETVLDDSRDFADKLKVAGVDVDCQVWKDMIHVFQQFPEILPEAKTAISDLSRFLEKHVKSPDLAVSMTREGTG